MTQPKSLYLADILEDSGKPADIAESAAAELRRLHAENERCRDVCAATAEGWREDREAMLKALKNTAPPQRQPLTDDQIGRIWFRLALPGVTETQARLIIRAAEKMLMEKYPCQT